MRRLFKDKLFLGFMVVLMLFSTLPLTQVRANEVNIMSEGESTGDASEEGTGGEGTGDAQEEGAREEGTGDAQEEGTGEEGTGDVSEEGAGEEGTGDASEEGAGEEGTGDASEEGAGEEGTGDVSEEGTGEEDTGDASEVDTDEEGTDEAKTGEDDTDVNENVCKLTEGCIRKDGHVGECLKSDEVCEKSEDCILKKGHEGSCMTEEELLEFLTKYGVNQINVTDEEILFTVTANPTTAYFGEELSVNVYAECPQSNKETYFYIRIDADRAELKNSEVTDKSGKTIQLIETQDGYYFTLDSTEGMVKTEYTLTFKSDENATETLSNPAWAKLYTGKGTSLEDVSVAENASVELYWSASSDKLQYSIDLYWKTADEGKKYEQTYDTVVQSTIDVTYVLNIITSSGSYDTGKMEVRLPLALWMYRDGTACIPSEISLKKAPDVPDNQDVRYHYSVDDKGTETQADDELVIKNWCKVPAGTDTTIEVKYTVDPVKTIDMSKAELRAHGSASTDLQATPEIHDTNSITYQLDTGFSLKEFVLYRGITCLYSKSDLPSAISADADFENYRYISLDVRKAISEDNQGTHTKYKYSDSLCENAEVCAVEANRSVGNFGSNFQVVLSEDNTWSYQTKATNNYNDTVTIYVRYPVTQDKFQPEIELDITASDDDSHSESDGDHNDLAQGKVSLKETEWKGYQYNAGWLEKWSKRGGSSFPGGVEVLKSGKSPGEFKWDLSQSYNGNLLDTNVKQKFEIYDDFHFWNLGENGAYVPMTEEDYEIVSIGNIYIYYSQVNLINGETVYPDFGGGQVTIDGYRNGSWETIKTINVIKKTDRKESLLCSAFMPVEDLSGQGYTRVRVTTPEVGRGELVCSIGDVQSEIKPTSPTFATWAESNPDFNGAVYVYDVAAFKHFITDADGNFVWNDSRNVIGWNYSVPPTSICSYIEQRDQDEKNYGETSSDKSMLRSMATGSLSPITYKSAIRKTSDKIYNNTEKQRVDVTFSVEEGESTNMSQSFATQNPEVANAFKQTKGIFYDLLPVGYYYNTESAPRVVRLDYPKEEGVTVKDVKVIDNWDGTGRQMVIFQVACDEGYDNFKLGAYHGNLSDLNPSSGYNYASGFKITFDAYITWKDLVYVTGSSYNLVAFQSGKTIKGNSLSDDGLQSASSAIATQFKEVLGRDGQPAFYDMDGDGIISDHSTLYAYASVSIDAATAVEVGIDKRVKGNGGVYTSIDTTNPGDNYKYRIGVTNSPSGTLKDLIIYDVLEDAGNKEGATGEVTWKGSFVSIDLSRAKALGVDPVVYYSTKPDLDYNTATGSVQDTWIENTDVWTQEQPSDLSKITAIAVDMRKKTDGSDFELPNSGCVYFEITMKAPDDIPQIQNPNMIYAINRPAYSCYRQTNTSPNGEYATVIGTRVKISMQETTRTVKKVWSDAENQDGVRPSSVEVQLYAGNNAYGDPVTLSESNNWAYTWDNLALKANGQTIEYKVVEKAIVDEAGKSIYTAKYDYDKEKCEFTITNTHAPATVYVYGEKTWNDENNQDGIRPDFIKVKLLANTGENGSNIEVASQEVRSDSEGKWSWTFDNLPKYAQGKEITYTVNEEAVEEGYTATYNGMNITNTHDPAEIKITVNKEWADNNNQDGKRPDSIKVNLYKVTDDNDDLVKSADVALKDGEWTYSFTDLPKYENGKLIQYKITEETVPGYSTFITGLEMTKENNEYICAIKNTHTPETIEISGNKVWDDNSNKYLGRPSSITVILSADTGENGEVVEVGHKTVSADDNWSWKFDNLAKYKGGKLIRYEITEEIVADYSTVITDLEMTEVSNDYSCSITNTYTPGKTSVKVTKSWNDADNQDGIRPSNIEVQLLANGESAEKIGVEDATVTLNEDNSWSCTWENLPVKYNKEEITYSVKELTEIKGYDVSITSQNENNFTITNTHTPELIEIGGAKIWDDADDQDGKRPDSITVNLYKVNGDNEKKLVRTTTVRSTDDWKYSFTELPKYEGGKEINYEVSEQVLDGYTASVDALYNITNTHEPETITINGTKTWKNDDDNKYSSRPSSITVVLWANTGENNEDEKVGSITVGGSDGWGWKFEGLAKYKGGELIQYKITEEIVADYSTVITDLEMTEVSNDYSCSITNTYTPGKTSVKVTKSWNDADNQDGIRPSNIEVQLLANGESAEKIGVEDATVTLNEDNSWSCTWENLPVKYNKEEITYSVKELTEIKGYDVSITSQGENNFTIMNTHAPETVYVYGEKTWNDADNQDGIRPQSITVLLMAKVGENGLTSEFASMKVEPDKDGKWSWRFDNLPKYEKGVKIYYSISEKAVDGYQFAPDYKNGFFNLINTHEPETIEITVNKKWVDEDNQDGKRPDSITVQLEAGNKAYGDPVTLSLSNNWTYTWTDLPKYAEGEQGQVITYTVVETAVEGYKTTITGSMETGYEITNTHDTEKISVSGEKIWEDNNNQDGLRPDSIKVHLYANGNELTDKTVTVTASTDGKWSFTFENLDKFINGEEVTYTVKEEITDDVAKEAYTSQITGKMAEGFTITNTHTPETVEISGTKTWDDENNKYLSRPSSITVNLLADGKVIKSEVVTAGEDGTWTYSFTELPKYKYENGKGGVEINYAISEENVEGYSTTYAGYDITNSYTPGKTSRTVEKVWADNDNQDGIRPAEIKVVLLANGKTATNVGVSNAEVTLSASNSWKYTWYNLPVKYDKKDVDYTVQEISEIEGYETTYTNSGDTTTITNKHTPETIEISGTKTWDDADNQDGLRPQEIKINLLVNDEVKYTTVASANTNNWSWSFTGLPKYENGKLIPYTISEEAIDGYSPTITELEMTKESNKYKCTIKNTHTPALIEISGTKTWNDNNNKYLGRPESITVYLLADGKVIDTKEVTEALGWTYKFTDLPKYAAGQQGHEIVYTIQEEAVVDYSTTYDGFNIKNDYTPGDTSKTVTKIWDDEEDQDGLRPAEIKVVLLANGETADAVGVANAEVTLDASNNWTYTWTKLPVKYDKKDVTYTVKELGAVAADGSIKEITGYTAAYSEDTFTITNTHTPETIVISGIKTWNDENNKYLSRPESITVNLLADGEVKESKVITEADNWEYSFTNLPKYKYENGQGGVLITYTISEEKVEGYSAAYNDYDIANSYTPEKTSKTVTKIWEDGENQDGLRPDSITVVLLANSETAKAVGVADAEVTLNASNNWTYTWNELPVKYNKKDVTYTVQEISEIEGYDTTYTNSGDITTITNKHTPEKTGRNVVKIWDDSNNADKLRSTFIRVQLYADNVECGDAVTLNKANNWSYVWPELPAKKAGAYIVYTVREITNVSGYTTTVTESGTTFTIVNYHPVTPSPTPVPPTESPEVTPTPIPTPSSTRTPVVTPTPEVTPSSETQTPDVTPQPSVEREEEVTTEGDRVPEKGVDAMVLGVKRATDCAVLGKRRKPATGDDGMLSLWMAMLVLAGTIATGAGCALYKEKHKGNIEND